MGIHKSISSAKHEFEGVSEYRDLMRFDKEPGEMIAPENSITEQVCLEISLNERRARYDRNC